jgi:hypothetical protein
MDGRSTMPFALVLLGVVVALRRLLLSCWGGRCTTPLSLVQVVSIAMRSCAFLESPYQHVVLNLFG